MKSSKSKNLPNSRSLLDAPDEEAKEAIFRLVAEAAGKNINSPIDYAYWTGYLDGAAWLFFAMKNNLIDVESIDPDKYN